jgi:hypothetical protein
LEFFRIIYANLSIVLLGLELQLNVENGNFGVCELLWLLLETSIRESFFEANTLDEE